MRRLRLGTAFVLVTVAGLVGRSEGDQLTITGPVSTQNAMIDENVNYYGGHSNWGGSAFANVSPIDYGFRENMLIRFDLPPLNDARYIRSATLTLHRNGYLSNEGILRLYRLTESWSEGTNTAGLAGDGMVDWVDRFHGSVPWSVPGAVGVGSSLADPSAVYLVSGEYTINIDVTQDVIWWYQNGANTQNFGWVMTDEDSDHQWRYGIRFESDDSPSPSLRPALTISYILPEPSSVTLLILGGTAMMFWRRRKGR